LIVTPVTVPLRVPKSKPFMVTLPELESPITIFLAWTVAAPVPKRVEVTCREPAPAFTPIVLPSFVRYWTSPPEALTVLALPPPATL